MQEWGCFCRCEAQKVLRSFHPTPQGPEALATGSSWYQGQKGCSSCWLCLHAMGRALNAGTRIHHAHTGVQGRLGLRPPLGAQVLICPPFFKSSGLSESKNRDHHFPPASHALNTVTLWAPRFPIKCYQWSLGGWVSEGGRCYLRMAPI